MKNLAVSSASMKVLVLVEVKELLRVVPLVPLMVDSMAGTMVYMKVELWDLLMGI